MSKTITENSSLRRPMITIFTPTFNRAHTLHELYLSLLEQTDKDFEWLIIDDGSSDQSKSMVEGWQQEGKISIRYIYQENGGKHIAYNHALEVADSVLFWPLDSDDLAVPTSVERIKFHWYTMVLQKSSAKAISFLVNNTDGKKWNDDFKVPYFEEHFPELIYNKTIRDDIWFVFVLSCIKTFRYPEKWRSIYVPDSLMPYAISANHPVRFVNERLGIYRWNPADADRLSNFSRPENLKSGGAASLFLQYWIKLNYGNRYILRYPLTHLKVVIQFHRFGDLANLGLYDRLCWIDSKVVKLISMICVPCGWIAARITDFRHRKYFMKT
jgi:glycosyltransferase involved in cell wall biosynthesis